MKLDDNGAAYFVEMVETDEEEEEIHPGDQNPHFFSQLGQKTRQMPGWGRVPKRECPLAKNETPDFCPGVPDAGWVRLGQIIN